MLDEPQQPPVEETAPGEAVVESAPTEEPEFPTEGTSQEEAPEEDKSKEAFIRYRQENKQLRDELNALRGQQVSAFDSLKSKPEVNNDGVNWGQYGVYDPNQVAVQVRAEAEQATQDKLDEFTARQQVPEMADPEFEELVASSWFRKRYAGESPSITNEAKRLQTWWNRASKKQQEIAVQKAVEQVSEKEEASLTSIGTNSNAAQQALSRENLEDLKLRSRKGDESAIFARLREIPPK